jgi:hypothetical protein
MRANDISKRSDLSQTFIVPTIRHVLGIVRSENSAGL